MQEPPEEELKNDETVDMSTRDTIPQKQPLLHSECTEHAGVAWVDAPGAAHASDGWRFAAAPGLFEERQDPRV
jgi:hypothetical protein